jgi:hypothetical protein
MTDGRSDYIILASISTQEEAAVMVAALHAEGIPAMLGNGHHATAMGFGAVALGGLQVMVPASVLHDAQSVLRHRMQEDWNLEGDDGPVAPKKSNRWKAWALLALFAWPVVFILPMLFELIVTRWGGLFQQWFGG